MSLKNKIKNLIYMCKEEKLIPIPKVVDDKKS